MQRQHWPLQLPRQLREHAGTTVRSGPPHYSGTKHNSPQRQCVLPKSVNRKQCAYQFAWINLKCRRDPQDVALTAFDPTDVRPMQCTPVSKRFLAEAQFGPPGAHTGTEHVPSPPTLRPLIKRGLACFISHKSPGFLREQVNDERELMHEGNLAHLEIDPGDRACRTQSGSARC